MGGRAAASGGAQAGGAVPRAADLGRRTGAAADARGSEGRRLGVGPRQRGVHRRHGLHDGARHRLDRRRPGGELGRSHPPRRPAVCGARGRGGDPQPWAVRRRVPHGLHRRRLRLDPGPGPGGTGRGRARRPADGHVSGHHRGARRPGAGGPRAAPHDRRLPVRRKRLADRVRQRRGRTPARLRIEPDRQTAVGSAGHPRCPTAGRAMPSGRPHGQPDRFGRALDGQRPLVPPATGPRTRRPHPLLHGHHRTAAARSRTGGCGTGGSRPGRTRGRAHPLPFRGSPSTTSSPPSQPA